MAKKYTRAQWNAYHSGRGYRLGYEKRAIEFKNPNNKNSFRKGYSSIGKRLDKYKKIPRKKKS